MRKKFTYTESETLQCVEIALNEMGMKIGHLSKISNRNRKTVRDTMKGTIDPHYSTVLKLMEQLGYRPTFEWVGLPENDNEV